MDEKEIEISVELLAFFENELENEHEGRLPPSTLGSALDSWNQADETTRAEWTGIQVGDLAFLVALLAVETELKDLIQQYGSQCLIEDIMDDAAEPKMEHIGPVEVLSIISQSIGGNYCPEVVDQSMDNDNDSGEIILDLCDRNGRLTHWIIRSQDIREAAEEE